MPLKADVGGIKCSLTFVTCTVVSEWEGQQEALQKHNMSWSSWILCFSLGCCYWKWGNTVALTAKCAIHDFLLSCDFNSLGFFSLKSYLATIFFNQIVWFLWGYNTLDFSELFVVKCKHAQMLGAAFLRWRNTAWVKCVSVFLLRHSYHTKIYSLSLSREMKELHGIILAGSCTDNSTHPAKVNSKVFTEWATEEMHLYGLTLGEMMLNV